MHDLGHARHGLSHCTCTKYTTLLREDDDGYTGRGRSLIERKAVEARGIVPVGFMFTLSGFPHSPVVPVFFSLYFWGCSWFFFLFRCLSHRIEKRLCLHSTGRRFESVPSSVCSRRKMLLAFNPLQRYKIIVRFFPFRVALPSWGDGPLVVVKWVERLIECIECIYRWMSHKPECPPWFIICLLCSVPKSA